MIRTWTRACLSAVTVIVLFAAFAAAQTPPSSATYPPPSPTNYPPQLPANYPPYGEYRQMPPQPLPPPATGLPEQPGTPPPMRYPTTSTPSYPSTPVSIDQAPTVYSLPLTPTAPAALPGSGSRQLPPSRGTAQLNAPHQPNPRSSPAYPTLPRVPQTATGGYPTFPAAGQPVPSDVPGQTLPPPSATPGPRPPDNNSPLPSGPVLPPPSTLPPESLPATDPGSPAYQWFNSGYWLRPLPWDGSFEIGINGTEGNSETLSLTVGATASKKMDLHEWKFKANYIKSTADQVETANNALLNADYERLFSKNSPWSLFTKSLVEYDEFKAFDVRFATNGGLAYKFINTKPLKLKGRFGAGASREFGGPNERWVPEAAFGADYEHQLTKRQKLVATVDYYPEWGDFENFRMITNVGWEVLLDEAANLNLKLGIIDRYDSTPNGAKPNDLNYSLLLLWKS